MANFGIGLGAFANGLTDGMQLGEQINQVRDRNRMRKTQREAYDSAKRAREQDISSQIQPMGLSDGPGFMGQAAQGFQVGGKTYDSRDAARSAASEKAAPFMDYFMDVAAPKIQEGYLANGDVAKAEAWGKWVGDRRSRKAIQDWGKSYMAARSGDWEKAASGFGEYYSDYIDDGVDYVSNTPTKDAEGNVTGFTIRLRDKESGRTTEMPMTIEDVMRLGSANNPQSLFEAAQAEYAAQRSSAAELAKEQRDWQRTTEELGYKNELGMNRDTHKSNLRMSEEAAKNQAGGGSDNVREANAAAAALRGIGYSDEQIRAMYPSLLGVYRASRSPQDRLQSTMETLAKSDFNYARLPADQQVERAQQVIAEMDKAMAESTPRNQSSQQQGGGGGLGLPMWGPGGITNY